MVNIITHFWRKPIPIRTCDWIAYDADTYDGAPDSSVKARCVGYGETEQEAIGSLMSSLHELGDDATSEHSEPDDKRKPA